MVMPMDHAFTEHNAERTRAADSILFGATTYRGMVQFWPSQVDVPGLPEEHLYVAQRYAEGLPSRSSPTRSPRRTPGPGATRPRSCAARTRGRGRAAREQDGDTVVFGSRTLSPALLAEGLVDELHLMVGPKLVAGDQHAFAGVPETTCDWSTSGASRAPRTCCSPTVSGPCQPTGGQEMPTMAASSADTGHAPSLVLAMTVWVQPRSGSCGRRRTRRRRRRQVTRVIPAAARSRGRTRMSSGRVAARAGHLGERVRAR